MYKLRGDFYGLNKKLSSMSRSNLIWVQSKVWIQQLPSIVIRVSFIDFIGWISNLYIHGSIRHPVVLEALCAADTTNNPYYYFFYYWKKYCSFVAALYQQNNLSLTIHNTETTLYIKGCQMSF